MYTWTLDHLTKSPLILGVLLSLCRISLEVLGSIAVVACSYLSTVINVAELLCLLLLLVEHILVVDLLHLLSLELLVLVLLLLLLLEELHVRHSHPHTHLLLLLLAFLTRDLPLVFASEVPVELFVVVLTQTKDSVHVLFRHLTTWPLGLLLK